MKKIKHIINTVIWTVVGLYFGITILVNLPFVQRFIGDCVSESLARKLGTRVEIGRVDLGLFNRIIIDDVHIFDQKGKPMLAGTRLSAKFDYLSLAQGKIVITSAQLFGLDARLYQEIAGGPTNFQFVIDSLSSKKPQTESHLELSIGSLIVRHGAVSFDQYFESPRRGFDSHHLHLANISGHLVLNRLTNDSLNLNLKKLSLTEHSGLELKELAFALKAGRQGAELSHFRLRLPSSEISSDLVQATYKSEGKKILMPSLQFSGSVKESVVTPNDLLFLLPTMKHDLPSMVFNAEFSGTSTQVRLKRLEATVPVKGAPARLTAPSDIHVLLSGSCSSWDSEPRWFAQVTDLSWTDNGLKLMAERVPDVVNRLGHFSFQGQVGGRGKDVAVNGVLRTGVGNASLHAGMHGNDFSAKLNTQGIDLGKVVNNDAFGLIATNIQVRGDLHTQSYQAKGRVSNFAYNKYVYHNLLIDGTYGNKTLNGHFSINDPNIAADLRGGFSWEQSRPSANLVAKVSHVNPAVVTPAANRWKGKSFSGVLEAHFAGKDINTANGNLTLSNFDMRTSDGGYHLDQLTLVAENNGEGHHLSLNSDFADINFYGKFDYNTFLQSFENLIVDKLPSIQQLTPIRYRRTQQNEFSMEGVIYKSDWLNALLNIPVEIVQPLSLQGNLSDRQSAVNANVSMPEIKYKGTQYKDAFLHVTTLVDTLKADVRLVKCSDTGNDNTYRLLASAFDDQLSTTLLLDNHAKKQRLRGKLNSVTQFFRNRQGQAEARVGVKQSEISIGDTILTVSPATISYSKNRLAFDHFSFSHGNQKLEVNGVATNSRDDSLIVDLQNVNVSYVLDLVNFHSVKFSGFASGKAYLSTLFGRPNVHADLQVDEFCFQDGHMGTLFAGVKWDKNNEQIDIDAEAIDSLGTDMHGRSTLIQGYVSPKRNYIDLNFNSKNTRGDFVEGFCSNFLNHTDLTVNGKLRLWGDLGDPNLTGNMVADGQMGVIATNTVYRLKNDTLRFLYNEINFPHEILYDREGHQGTLTGSVYHDHLSHLSYDFNIRADHLLAYDWDGTDGSSFFGTVYGTGRVGIKGKPGQVNIDVNIRPEKGSQIVYNASTPDAISSQDFIHWASRDTLPTDRPSVPAHGDDEDIPSDIHVNFLVDATPDATLKVLMDNTTGDYISLNGSGTINASYYNKGGVSVFGNYVIDHGVYKLTIQNVIKREFKFATGGTIAFGGNPMDAALQLKALYPINSVSLADLQLGNSFSSNNIRVDCYMNITGTPKSPKVDFSLDMPTVGNDAKQMIYSLINSEEEMNQQVLYLLAVGRFYSQGSNNAAAEESGQNQTSLAMQSILSGQISQQINNVLGMVVNNTNWNFGANISTGDEGWNNAEYEGLLSGRLLNNRLLVNGQFGYRDNANATTSFIGDFDIRYLISPNGNFSIRVYNQTNDRYFTRSTLNTQGIGFVLKKDFSNWRDLFSRKKKKVKSKK